MNKQWIGAVCLALFDLSATVAFGEEYRVSPEFPGTIQTLIDFVVNDGDTILLEPGEFSIPATIRIEHVSISLRGSVDAKSGALLTTISPEFASRILYINQPGCVVDSIRIANGDATNGGSGMFDSAGGGLFADTESDAIRLSNCVFESNRATYGGGAYLRGDGAILEDCAFIENSVSLNGAGLALFDSDDSEIVGGDFRSNSAGNDGGAMYLVGRDTLVHACVVKSNTAVSAGGILVPSGTSTMRMSSSEVCGNTPVQVFGNWTDLGKNAVGDACDCLGDIDGDGQVGGTELGLLFSLWGTGNSLLDLNRDGSINAADLGILLGVWGNCD